ncbi:hypothetical protein D9M68_875830 [compost metagenome]
MRDGETIAGILVAEEVVEIVEARPGDRRQTHRAGLMRGEEDEIAGVRALSTLDLVEALQRVHFAVPERVFRFVVGLDEHGRKIGLAHQCRAEDLVAGSNTGFRCRDDAALHRAKQCIEELVVIGLLCHSQCPFVGF